MNGCRWQEKSFSVGYVGQDEDFCKCGKIFGTITYKINGEKVCQDCWDKKEMKMVELSIEGLSEAMRPKDKLWHFVDTLNFREPMEFTSKKAWENECKKRNLIYVGKGEVSRVKPRKFESVPIETKKNLIREEMKKLGIYDSSKLFKRR